MLRVRSLPFNLRLKPLGPTTVTEPLSKVGVLMLLLSVTLWIAVPVTLTVTVTSVPPLVPEPVVLAAALTMSVVSACFTVRKG